MEIGIQNTSSEGLVMGRLGDEDGVRGFWESDGFVIGCFGEFEVFIFSIVKNALNHE